MPSLRLPAALLRWRYLVVAAVYVVAASYGDNHAGDLEALLAGTHLLFGHGPGTGLHLYAANPQLQMGPLTFVLVHLLPGHVQLWLVVAALLLLVLTLRALEVSADEDVRARLVVGGTVLACFWASAVPGWAHLDDLLTLTCLAGAVAAARRLPSRTGALLTGAGLGLAVGFKPWGMLAIALVLVLPGSRRLLAATVAGAIAAACWVPFVIAAPATLRALSSFSIPAMSGSLPALLGYGQAPHWERAAQLLAATLVIVMGLRRGRTDLALLALGASRLLLDAGTFGYYDVELVLGALLVDLVSRPKVPLTALAALLPALTLLHLGGTDLGLCRAGLLALVIGLGLRPSWHPRELLAPPAVAVG